MQFNIRLLAVASLAIAITFTACKKEDSTTPEADNSSEIKTHTDDDSNVSSQLDDISTESDAALSSDVYFSGRVLGVQTTNSICGATSVIDTGSNPRTITITYNGNNCVGTHLRTGSVIISVPAGVRWKNQGAAVTLTFQNLKIKRLSDNKSITINGSQTFTNVSGGLLAQLATLQSITHTVTSSNMSITFDDGSQRVWQLARRQVFTYNNGYVLTISGFGVSGSLTNVAEWGSNRFGHAFTTSITGPLVFRQDCNGRLTSGEIKHQGFATATVTFGLNSSGAATTCPGTGNYYYRLVWMGPAGNSITAVLPY